MRTRKKNYSPEYKREAIALAESMGNTAAAAKQLGIGESLLYSWKNRSKEKLSKIPVEDSGHEIQRLRKENAKLKKVNEILKAAAAFFSQDHLK